jgi:DNA invertase Pin-like site-specific DNA recombinase
MKRTALYLRVSTSDQSVDSQRHALMEVAKQSGWNIVHTFEDRAVSGAKGRNDRPAFKAMLDACTRREIDLIAVWSIDRLGRSLQDLVGFLQDIDALGVDLFILKQSLDTSTPSGKLLFNICGVFAEFERAIISERVRAGLDKARANGKTLGRPPMDDNIKAAVIALKRDGKTMREIANTAGISIGAVHKVLAKEAETLC